MHVVNWSHRVIAASRRVMKMGTKLVICLTTREAKVAGLIEGTSVVVAAEVGRVIVSVRAKPSLEQMLTSFDPKRHGGEAMADAPVGAERIGLPSADWRLMRSTFGDPLLTRLVGITPDAMLRYAEGTQVVSEKVFKRLGWLAVVAFDLAGGYNPQGVRRWFARPRVQLDGRCPMDTLGKRWSPEGNAASRVRALAALVSGTKEALPRYEADDGPLTPSQLDAVRKLAAASLPTGKVLGKKKLL